MKKLLLISLTAAVASLSAPLYCAAETVDSGNSIVILKDSAGKILNGELIPELREKLATGSGRFMLKLDIGSDFDAFMMGEDADYEASILQKIDLVERDFLEEINDRELDKNVKIFHRPRPLPWLIVDVDSKGLDVLLESDLIQIIAEPVQMVPFMNEALPLTQATTLHAAGGTGTGKAVAVLDSGVQLSHPMFAGKIISQACFVTVVGASEGCPLGYGSTGPGSAEACTRNANCTHGTHVAGIATGIQTIVSGKAISGVAYSAPLVAVRVMRATSSNTYFSVDDGVAALTYLYNNRISLNLASVNLSVGKITDTVAANSYCDDYNGGAMAQAINLLAGARIPVVAASGSSSDYATPPYAGKIAFPACVEKAIAVSSVSKNGRQETATSGLSSVVDLLAPGGSEPNSVISTGNILSAITVSNYGYRGGTSMAAPHVAGAIAALKSGPWAASTPTVDQMVDHLKNTGILVTHNIDGSPTTYNHKLIQLGNAIVTPSVPTFLSVDPMHCYGSNSVNWSASTGTLTHYELHGSSNSSYTSSYPIPVSAFWTINVSGTTWLRLRACNGPSCSGWRNGDQPATYTHGCI